jgi:hypothetical protein
MHLSVFLYIHENKSMVLKPIFIYKFQTNIKIVARLVKTVILFKQINL